MTEHPNARDYANRAERTAAYWREEMAAMIPESDAWDSAKGLSIGYNRVILIAALTEARRRCTHHGQIVAFTVKEMEDRTPWRLGKPLERHVPQSRIAAANHEVQSLIGATARSLGSGR